VVLVLFLNRLNRITGFETSGEHATGIIYYGSFRVKSTNFWQISLLTI